jgi:hypothetical protein
LTTTATLGGDGAQNNTQKEKDRNLIVTGSSKGAVQLLGATFSGMAMMSFALGPASPVVRFPDLWVPDLRVPALSFRLFLLTSFHIWLGHDFDHASIERDVISANHIRTMPVDGQWFVRRHAGNFGFLRRFFHRR